MNKKKIFVGLVLIILLVSLICAPYFFSYKPSGSAVEIIKSSNIKYNDKRGYLTFQGLDGDPINGYILYPGGLVSPYAYSTFCNQIIKNGALCVIPKMPGNLAIFGVDKAEKIIADNPTITNWYIGGHSLGGPMMSRFIEKYKGDKIKGIFFLASYTDIDLSDSNLKCVSIVGSEDKILNREVYDKNRSNFPKNCNEVTIQGGNHSQFGSYGLQKGDGESTIINESQVYDSTDILLSAFNENLCRYNFPELYALLLSTKNS